MKTIELTPLLEARTKRGLTSYWQGAVKQDDDGGVFLQFLSFQRMEDSEENQSVLKSTPKRVIGKNKGRSNETSDIEQAKSELKSKMNDMKVRKGYHEEGQQEILIGPRPMLAHNFKDHGKKMPFPCYGQPKYDGFRMLQDQFNVWSRGNKGYIEDCIKHLRLFELLKELTTDGEIMLPLDSGQFNLSQSRINKFYGPEDSPSSSELHYYIYDLIIPGTFRERWAVLNDWFFELQDYGDWPENIELVPTWLIQNETELQERFDWCLDNGFEGIMLRNPNGLYETGDRSYELLKLKPYGTAEAEFEIVDITEGRGSNEGCVKFICKIAKGDANFKPGKTFKCNPKWPLPKRKKLFDEFKQGKWKPIGRMLTVVYDDRTKTEVPRFPVAKNIRDYDLQGGNEGK